MPDPSPAALEAAREWLARWLDSRRPVICMDTADPFDDGSGEREEIACDLARLLERQHKATARRYERVEELRNEAEQLGMQGDISGASQLRMKAYRLLDSPPPPPENER